MRGWFVVPIEQGRKTTPKYLNFSRNVLRPEMDYNVHWRRLTAGRAIVRVDGPLQLLQDLAAQSDVFAFPSDLTKTLGPRASTVASRMEQAGVPADDVDATTTWAEVRDLCYSASFLRACCKKDKVDQDVLGKLDEDAPVSRRDALGMVLARRGIDPGTLPTGKVRDVVRAACQSPDLRQRLTRTLEG